jgi:hypothetical protein
MCSQAASAAGIVDELMGSRYDPGLGSASGRPRGPTVVDY